VLHVKLFAKWGNGEYSNQFFLSTAAHGIHWMTLPRQQRPHENLKPIQMDNIVLSPISLEALIQQIREVVKQELSAQKSADVPDRLLSPAEAVKLFSPAISTKSLSSWTKQGLVQSTKISRRVYYKHSDIIAAGVSLKKYKRS
jgi:hypothetical protein